MKTLTKRAVILGGSVTLGVSLHKLLSSTFVWRYKATNELWAQLQAMLDDVPSERIELATNDCQVEYLTIYADWSSPEHDLYRVTDRFYSEEVPQFVEYERKRQIYTLVAERFAAIDSFQAYGLCQEFANELSIRVNVFLETARHNGMPLDELLRSIR